MIKHLKLQKEEGFTIEEMPGCEFFCSDTNGLYFDIPQLLSVLDIESQDPVNCFIEKYKAWMEFASDYYEIQPDLLIVQDTVTGHIMMDHRLMPLYLAHMLPLYMAFVLDTLGELFLRGIAISDNTLFKLLQERFSKETLTKILDQYET